MELCEYDDQYINGIHWIPLKISKKLGINGRSRISEGAPTPEGCANLIFCKFFAENCMKMKEFGLRGECASLASPLPRSVTDTCSTTHTKHKYRYFEGTFFGKILPNNRLASFLLLGLAKSIKKIGSASGSK